MKLVIEVEFDNDVKLENMAEAIETIQDSAVMYGKILKAELSGLPETWDVS